MDAYERLLGDAMDGDAMLFARQDAVEAAWEVVEPILKTSTPVYAYEPGRNRWTLGTRHLRTRHYTRRRL